MTPGEMPELSEDLGDKEELGQGAVCPGPVDFSYLTRQTLGDLGLQREVLDLFVAQSRRIVPTIEHLTIREQDDACHLLKGSAAGIGAVAAAAAAGAYGRALPNARAALRPQLAEAFAATDAAITDYLATVHR